jgi:hypothetical protein
VQDMVAPRAWCAPTPTLAPPFVFCYGCLRVGGTGKPASFHTLDVLGDMFGLLGLRCSIRHSPLVGQLARVDDEKAELCLIEAPVSILHGHRADDTLPVPASWRLLPCPAWLFEQERQRPVLLAPRLHFLAYSTRTRHQGDEPHPPLKAQAERAFTIGLTIGHNAAHSVESKCQTLFNGYGRLRTVAGVTITHTHAEREAITAYAKTEEDLLELVVAVFAMSIGRVRCPRKLRAVLIGPI